MWSRKWETGRAMGAPSLPCSMEMAFRKESPSAMDTNGQPHRLAPALWALLPKYTYGQSPGAHVLLVQGAWPVCCRGGPLCAASSGGQLPSSPPQKTYSPALTQGKPTSGRHPGRAPQPPQMLEVPPVSRRCFLSLPTPCSTCLWMGCPQGHLYRCGAFQKYLTST